MLNSRNIISWVRENCFIARNNGPYSRVAFISLLSILHFSEIARGRHGPPNRDTHASSLHECCVPHIATVQDTTAIGNEGVHCRRTWQLRRARVYISTFWQMQKINTSYVSRCTLCRLHYINNPSHFACKSWSWEEVICIYIYFFHKSSCHETNWCVSKFFVRIRIFIWLCKKCWNVAEILDNDKLGTSTWSRST